MLLAPPKGGFEIIASPIPFSLSYKALSMLAYRLVLTYAILILSDIADYD